MGPNHSAMPAFVLLAVVPALRAQNAKDLGLQLAANPPMQVLVREPPDLPAPTEDFDVRPDFIVIESLDAFRAAIKQDGQRVRLKPGVYRATSVDPPLNFPVRHAPANADGTQPVNEQQHIFAVTGSNNHFDLRGCVLETPTSLQSKLSGKAHVADSWHINGDSNVIEGGWFVNVTDQPYPDYRVTECEFEVCGDHNTFVDCTFIIRGSVPYGYTDYYGKGGPNFGRLNKHSFMSLDHANDTTLRRCRVYQQAFGHGLHLHTVDGVRVEDCYFTGALRPTNDIYHEVEGRAKEYDFKVMYRGERPIPRDEYIPLVEDGIRAYDNVRNVTVVNTTIERYRGCLQLLCPGDVTLENVTVLECGDFSYDLSAGKLGRVVMRNCRGDVAYNPVFNLTRGDVPYQATYELTLLSPPEGAPLTPRSGLGVIAGDGCTFILHDGLTRPLPEAVAVLVCGGRKGLVDSTVVNETAVRLVLEKSVRNCTIRSVGVVEDQGTNNTIERITP